MLQAIDMPMQYEPPAHPWGVWDYVGYGALTFTVLWIISRLIRPRPRLKNWHHHFEDFQLSSGDLYSQIILEIKERKIPARKIGYAKYFEAGIFSARRRCLYIDYLRFSIEVSCIAFGTGYYVSWWLIEDDPSMVSNIPVLNDLLGKNPLFPSAYQLDIATLFHSGIHDAILHVLDKETEERGLRKMTERERQPKTGRW